MDAILIHFHEIVLKGKNRPFFENHLAVNIGRALKGLPVEKIKNFGGGFLLFLSEKAKPNEYIKRLSTIPGIANFFPVFKTALDYDELEKSVLKEFPKSKFKSFKIDARRAGKSFKLTSQDINQKLGEIVKEKTSMKVDLENPELTIYVDVHKEQIFFSFEKFEGARGMPVGSSGIVVSLMSGGIDSPVASQMIMKRGCRVIFVHFHSHPYTSTSSLEKAQELVEVLDKYQYDSKLYIVAFGDIQKKITLSVPPPYRVVVYRRLMLRIAQEIAKKEKAKALVTGESLGQVASQTIENIGVVEKSVDLSVFRPLLGMDKEEIIKRAKAIGSYNISIIPDEDCCTLFVPKHPATKTREEYIKKIESGLDVKNLVDEAVNASELKIFKSN